MTSDTVWHETKTVSLPNIARTHQDLITSTHFVPMGWLIYGVCSVSLRRWLRCFSAAKLTVSNKITASEFMVLKWTVLTLRGNPCPGFSDLTLPWLQVVRVVKESLRNNRESGVSASLPQNAFRTRRKIPNRFIREEKEKNGPPKIAGIYRYRN